MLTDHLARQFVKLEKFADLIRVSRRKDDFETSRTEFVDNRKKKWDMGRVVKVDPNPLSPS